MKNVSVHQFIRDSLVIGEHDFQFALYYQGIEYQITRVYEKTNLTKNIDASMKSQLGFGIGRAEKKELLLLLSDIELAIDWKFLAIRCPTNPVPIGNFGVSDILEHTFIHAQGES